MSHPIIMNWMNETSDTLAFGNVKVQDGTTPVASPPSMAANAASSVSADQSHNLTAGPVGSYSWTNAANANQSVGTQYNHPSGTGQTSVTVSCSSAYQVSDDNATWVQTQTYTNSSLQQHTAQISLYIRPAGNNPPPPPPPPPPKKGRGAKAEAPAPTAAPAPEKKGKGKGKAPAAPPAPAPAAQAAGKVPTAKEKPTAKPEAKPAPKPSKPAKPAKGKKKEKK